MQLSTVDLRLLRVFVTVVQSGGFTQAADVLNLGRPTISTHMADLESRLGMRLCDRGRSGFSLSEHGEQVYERVQQLLAALEEFNSDINAIQGRLSGELNLGQIDYMTSVPDFQISEVLQKFSDIAPDVRINLQVLPQEEVTKRLLDGRVHLGIVSGSGVAKGLEIHPFLDEKLFLYCGSEHALFKHRNSDLKKQQLADARFCGSTSTSDPLRKLRSLSSNTARANNLEAVLMLIRSGRYIGYLPDHFAQPWVDKGELRALKPAFACIHNTLPVITRSNARKNPQLQAFMGLLFATRQTVKS